MELIIYLVVTVIIMGAFSYSIGKSEVKGDDVALSFFISIVIAIFWPIVLAILILAGPFVIPYKLGVQKRENDKNKAQMWNKLKS